MRRLKFTILLCLFFPFISQTTLANRVDSLDITHYNLALSIRNLPSKTLSGKARIYGRPNFMNVQALTFDLLKLNVDSIFCNNVPVLFTQSDSTLHIILNKAYYQNDSVVLDIYYQGSPVRDSRWGGFYFAGDYAFNMGVGMGSNPPNFGRCWFPCNDNFTDRATYSFEITTDSGYMAVCSGMQESANVNANGSITWRWRLNQTIPTYLANIAVSKYVLINSKYVGLQREIPVVLAVAAADTAKAKASFFRLNQAMQCFEERFGPYLFDRVGYVGVPFNSGAMEHACNISYPLYAVDGTGNYETLMAHELAHNWFGNLVTTRTASDMWLNEGWASYCEALFLECAYGKNSYNEKIGSELFESMRWAHARDGGFLPVSGVPLAQTYGTHVYTKGGLMVHTLRNMMGDSAFFKACKNYLTALKFSDVNSFNLMDYFSGYSSVDMVDFFKTWIYDAGDHDIQPSEFAPQNTPDGLHILTSHQQRRNKMNLIKLAEPNLSIYYKNGSKWITPVKIEAGWTGKGKSNVYLSASQSKDIAFWVLNEDNKLVLGKTFQQEWIKTTGVKTFGNALLTFTVKNISDSALVYVEHHFAEPFFSYESNEVPSGIRLSRERFWRINGIWNVSNFGATAFFNYDGSTPAARNAGYLDNVLITGSEDSLVLLYRPNAQTAFSIETDLTFQPGGSKIDKVGRFWVNNLKQGDYVLGYRDMGASTNEIKGDRRKMLLYPNPTEGSLNLELPDQHGVGTLKICDGTGKVLKEWQVNHKENKLQINTSIYPQGMFYLIFEDNKGKITQSFIVK
jgi:aminopeptidase N